jgi:hypothetical protein
MPTPRRAGKRLFPNPFYALLLVVSTCFVVTILGYLVAPTVHGQAGGAGRPGGLADWLERRGPAALGVEFAVMLAAALLAMATDRWFPEKPTRPAPRRD